MKNILYVGPSWAARSYDTVEGSELNYTNLLQEFDIPAVNLSKPSLSNIQCLDIVNNYQKSFDAVIWVYCEPILDVPHQLKKDLLESENFWNIRDKINSNILEKINNLGCPVGMIGAHSDLVNCDYRNITIVHPSWQKFLANQIGIELEHGWGADVAHRYAMYELKNCKPSKSVVELITNTFKIWTQLELLGLWRGVHPNRNGNELFAKAIKSSVQSFINNL